jgi:hypothetical protein
MKPLGTAGSPVNRVRKLVDVTIRLTALFCLSSALSFAEVWSGALVDSKCYAALERNVNPTDTLTNVDHDGNLEIRYCAPRPKTKSFSVVQADGTILSFDSAGNVKATELVRITGKRSRFFVAVTGDRSGDTVRVDSIAVAR